MDNRAYQYGDVVLRPASDADQVNLRRWRNLPEVRNAMLTNHAISEAEHQRWWQKTRSDVSRRWYLCEVDGLVKAVLNYYDLDEAGGDGWWGFYFTDNLSGGEERLRLWLELEDIAIRHAFDALGCRRLLCETLAFNDSVLAVHRRSGFKQIEERMVQRNGKNESVIVMALSNPVATSSFSNGERQVTTAFFGSANWDIFGDIFRQQFHAYVGYPPSVVSVPFGQYALLINDPESIIYQQSIQLFGFFERFEDLLLDPMESFEPSDIDEIEQRFHSYLDTIETARSKLSGTFWVLGMASLQALPGIASREAKRLVGVFNRRLQSLCDGLPDCFFVPIEEMLAQHGRERSVPGKYWFLGRYPFSYEFSQQLANACIGQYLLQQGLTRRLLILDLDNTLWQGVIGDDGIDGIELSGDFPGNQYRTFQSYLKLLKENGIVLALCSKNTESIALQAIDEHPGMRLRRSDFVTWRINWRPKPENIQAIADELGLGLASVCFIDDSAYEREEVRQALPQVLVPEMPDNIEEWPYFLNALPQLTIGLPTDEDRKRAAQYQARAAIEQERSNHQSREAFLCSLSMQVRFTLLSPLNRQRVLQLLAKTNQFNTTTRRHGEADLERLTNEGAKILAVSLSDRFSDEEIIGVLILSFSQNVAEIDSLLLSCRVLGRDVEKAMLYEAERRTREAGSSLLEGEIIETPRNQPVRTLYSDNGFVGIGRNRYRLDLLGPESYCQLPKWLAIID